MYLELKVDYKFTDELKTILKERFPEFVRIVVFETADRLQHILENVTPQAKPRLVWGKGWRAGGRLRGSWKTEKIKEPEPVGLVFTRVPYAVWVDVGRRGEVTYTKVSGAYVFHIMTKKDETLIQMHRKMAREWVIIRKFKMGAFKGREFTKKALNRLKKELPEIIKYVAKRVGLEGIEVV